MLKSRSNITEEHNLKIHTDLNIHAPAAVVGGHVELAHDVLTLLASHGLAQVEGGLTNA